MKLYADRPARVVVQLLGDLLAVVAIYWAVRLGLAARDTVAALAAPGREAESAALRLDGTLRDTARDVGEAPLVGDTLSRPFRALAGASRDLAASAQSYQETVAEVAMLTGLMVGLVPILAVLALWAPRRISWVVEASAASRLMQTGPASLELLAVRALARQPLPDLARLGPGVVAGWRAGDPDAMRTLATLELRELGLTPRRALGPGRVGGS